MSQPLHSVDPLSSLSAQARQQLADVSHTPFSPEGFSAVQDQIDRYIGDLILESVRIMDRRQADTVSRRYVQQASENLVATSRRRLFTLVGTVGGILLGASVTTYLDIIRTGSPTTSEVIVAAVLGIVGVFMTALQFARE